MQKSHVVDYQVFGDDLQFVEVELDPGETVIAEGVLKRDIDIGSGYRYDLLLESATFSR